MTNELIWYLKKEIVDFLSKSISFPRAFQSIKTKLFFLMSWIKIEVLPIICDPENSWKNSSSVNSASISEC